MSVSTMVRGIRKKKLNEMRTVRIPTLRSHVRGSGRKRWRLPCYQSDAEVIRHAAGLLREYTRWSSQKEWNHPLYIQYSEERPIRPGDTEYVIKEDGNECGRSCRIYAAFEPPVSCFHFQICEYIDGN